MIINKIINKKIFIIIILSSCSGELAIERDVPAVHQINQSLSSSECRRASFSLADDRANISIIQDEDWLAELQEYSDYYSSYDVQVSGGWLVVEGYDKTPVLQTAIEYAVENNAVVFKSCDVLPAQATLEDAVSFQSNPITVKQAELVSLINNHTKSHLISPEESSRKKFSEWAVYRAYHKNHLLINAYVNELISLTTFPRLTSAPIEAYNHMVGDYGSRSLSLSLSLL